MHKMLLRTQDANSQSAPGVAASELDRRSPASSVVAERPYRADIDGLRAIAILGVVLYHAGIPWLTGGFTGVDIFFVISGYLIGGHIFSEQRAGVFSYFRFYQRRAKRILPALFAVTVFVLLAGMAMLSPREADRMGREAFAAMLSASNVIFWHGASYFDTRSELHPFLMTWSLGVEEQFYALIPWLMLVVARARRGALPVILAVCAVSFVLAWVGMSSIPTFVFYMLPSRAWELGAGVALAVVEMSPGRSTAKLWLHSLTRWWPGLITGLAGLALMVAPMFVLSAHTGFPGPGAVASVLGAVLAIAAPSSWINRRLLSLPPLVFVGRISYSWYLWHWPLLSFASILYGGPPPRAVSMLTATASFALAVGSYFLIEQPFRRSGLAPAPLLMRYAVAGAALLAVCATIWLGGGVPQRFRELAQVEDAGAPLASDPCLAENSAKPDRSPQCLDTADRRPAVALWGDSHGGAMAPALRALAHAQGYSFIEIGKAACPPMMGATLYEQRIPRLAAQCLSYQRNALDLLRSDPRIRLVVLCASWAGYLHRDWQGGWLISDLAHQRDMPPVEQTRAFFAQSLAASIRSLQAAGKQVLVMDDNPAFDFEPLWKIRTRRIPLRRELARWADVPNSSDDGFGPPGDGPGAASATRLVKATLASLPGTALIDLKAPFRARNGEYFYRDGERLLFVDNNHLSPDGASYALRGFSLPAPPGAMPQRGSEQPH